MRALVERTQWRCNHACPANQLARVSGADPTNPLEKPRRPPLARHDHRRTTASGEPGRTSGGGSAIQRGWLNPNNQLFGQVTSQTRQPRLYDDQASRLTNTEAPKSSDLSAHSADDLDWVAAELNDRPRKRLGSTNRSNRSDPCCCDRQNPPTGYRDAFPLERASHMEPPTVGLRHDGIEEAGITVERRRSLLHRRKHKYGLSSSARRVSPEDDGGFAAGVERRRTPWIGRSGRHVLP